MQSQKFDFGYAALFVAILFGAGAAQAQQYIYPDTSSGSTTYTNTGNYPAANSGANSNSQANQAYHTTYEYHYPAVSATTYPMQQYPAANAPPQYQTAQQYPVASSSAYPSSTQYQPVQVPGSQPAPAYQAAPQYQANPSPASSYNGSVSGLPSYSNNQQLDPTYQPSYQPGAPVSASSAPTVSAASLVPYMGLETRSGIDVSGQLAYYQYREPNVGVTETSDEPLMGLNVAGTYAFGMGFFARVEARYGFTDIDYEGSGTIDDRFVDTWEYRGLVGKDFVFPAYDLTPYTGLGFRTLYNDNRGLTTTGAAGYRRYNELTYLPIGIEPRLHLDSVSRLSTMLEFDAVLSGQQKSDLGDVGAGDPAIKNNQTGGYGLRGNIMYEMRNWSIGPYFNYWNIGASNNVIFLSPTGDACGGSGATYCIGGEPANHTIEVGLQIGYHFF